ncbi:hypothetical protein ACFL0S_03825 [Thermodesulfobacteriota bacterium]
MKAAIILSGCSVGLAIARSLGRYNVPVTVAFYDNKDIGYVSKFVSKSFCTPHPEKNEEDFIDMLVTYGKKTEGGVLFPANDSTLTAVSKNKSLLESYYSVACPSWEVTKKFIDKTYTYALAESIGVPAPRSLTPSCLAQAVEFGKVIDFPCLVKPCRSHIYFEHFKKKMVKVRNIDELAIAYKEALKANISVMIQEYIPGEDSGGVNYNSYFMDNRPIIEFTAQKERLAPPDTGLPRVVKSKHIPEVINPGRKIVTAFKFNGYSCTEFKKDIRDNIYKLMEVNGRHNRSGLLAVKCGINFPWIEYQGFVNQNWSPEYTESINFDDNVYWIDEILDLVYFLKSIKQLKINLLDYAKPYYNKHIFSVFDWGDVKPFLKRIGNGISRIKF